MLTVNIDVNRNQLLGLPTRPRDMESLLEKKPEVLLALPAPAGAQPAPVLTPPRMLALPAPSPASPAPPATGAPVPL